MFDSLQIATASLKSIGFGNQVNPRKTHFFMIKNEDRLRIDREGDGFKLHPTGEYISRNSMMLLAAEKPHVFSPNALLRPLYQQLTLPNVAYVCGPAELHYWHQLFPLFKNESVVAPILFLRDSFLFLDNKTLDFLQKYNLVESVVWKGFEVSSICLENVLIGENKLSQEIEELKNKTEMVFQTLFGLKYKNIKELRTQNEVWIKVLQKAGKSVLNDVRKQTAFEPVFNKLQKISSLYFDKNNPQERSLSWLELLLKTRNIPIDFLFDIPLSGHTFGTLSV
ncbi:MAG: bacillithiol biosynthesis BshC [Sphingomonadales bacterium]